MKLLFISIAVVFGSCAVYALWQRHSFQQWIEDGRENITSYQTAADQLPSKPRFPPLLESYLDRVLVDIPPAHCNFVSFKQEGLFRMDPTEKMTGFSAQQTVSLVAPLFSWQANVVARGLPVTVCDRLIAGKGEMQARLFGVFGVAKSSGSELLRGELLRYLAELPWYPAAILRHKQIQWQQVGDSSVKATITYANVEATMEYRFEEGLIQSIYTPDRERMVGSQAIPTPWLGEFGDYKEISGMILPSSGQVSWILPSGKFTYFSGEIGEYQLGCRPSH